MSYFFRQNKLFELSKNVGQTHPETGALSKQEKGCLVIMNVVTFLHYALENLLLHEATRYATIAFSPWQFISHVPDWNMIWQNTIRIWGQNTHMPKFHWSIFFSLITLKIEIKGGWNVSHLQKANSRILYKSFLRTLHTCFAF